MTWSHKCRKSSDEKENFEEIRYGLQRHNKIIKKLSTMRKSHPKRQGGPEKIFCLQDTPQQDFWAIPLLQFQKWVVSAETLVGPFHPSSIGTPPGPGGGLMRDLL